MSDSDQQDDYVLNLPIRDDHVLWRRIPANKWIFDENLGRTRPSSNAFNDHRDGSHMSVYDSENCGGIEAVMAGHDGFFLCSFTAAIARKLGFELMRTSSGGRGHCEVAGKKTKALQTQMAKTAEWVIAPVSSVDHRD